MPLRRLLLLLTCLSVPLSAAEALRVVCGQPGSDFPPFFQWPEDDEEPTGLDARLARAVAERLDRPLEFVRLDLFAFAGWRAAHAPDTVDGDYRIWALRHGHADLVVACLTITPARADLVAFSPAYAFDGLGVLVRRDGPVHAVEDLATARCYAEANTTAATWAAATLPAGQIRYQLPHAFASPGEALATGGIDAVINSAMWLETLAAEDDRLSVLPDLLEEERLGIGIAPGRPALAAAVDAAVQDLALAGELVEIYGRFGMTPER